MTRILISWTCVQLRRQLIRRTGFFFTLAVLLIMITGRITNVHAQSSPSISIELSPGHRVPQNTAITGTVTLSNLDVGSYSSVIFRADITGYRDAEGRCNGDDTGKDIEAAVDESREILTDLRIYDACPHYTYGNYTLDARIFRIDTSAPGGKVELASTSTQFMMSRYLTPGEVTAPPPASGVKAWLDPDPRTLDMRVGEWHRFRTRSDILLYLNDHVGVLMYGSEPGFFVAPGETTPSKSVEEACQGPYFIDSPWRRAIHQALWIGACKAGDGVIQVRHETDAGPPLYEYEFRTREQGGTGGNREPAFDEGANATRSVAENTPAGREIGAPVTATDEDGDALTYSLGGSDAALFSIDGGTGQIGVKAGTTLDYEKQTSYSVTVSVHDGKDANGNADTNIDATIDVTIVIDDEDDTPTLSIEDERAGEGDGHMVFAVVLRPASSEEVMVDYATQAGTAAEGTDYTRTRGTLTFPANSSTPQEIRVPMIDDSAGETDETFTVELSNVRGAALGVARATGTIADNDVTPPPPLPPPPSRPPPPPPPPPPPAPSAPDAPMVTETSTSSVTVSWSVPTDDGSPITSYDLRYREGSDGAFTDGPKGVTDTSAIIEGLSPDTAYEVQVRASSAAGDGEWSALGLVRTRALPPPAPDAPMVTEISATSVTVSWTAPTTDGPPITGYDLRYREGSDGEFTDGPQDVTDTSATITGLSPDTAYEVQVRASSTTGDGDWSAHGVLRTAVLILYDRFSLSLDLDGSEGDQSVSFLAVSPGRVVLIQIFGADIQNARGLSIRVGYDSTQVVFEAFDVGDMLPNAESLVARDSTFVEVGLASPGGQATVDSSLVGTLRFLTTDAFSETEIRLAGADVVRGEPPEAMTRSVSVALQIAGPPDPDFDGNGMVEFADFVLFAGAFGYREGDEEYDAKYDLHGDGGIGFADFVIFAGSFGNTVNRAPVFTFTPPVTRSVAENTPAGQAIGDPVSASDADGHALTYSLWGADAEHFAIDASTGQIRTERTYDFEQKRGYSVIVRAGDGQGGRVSLVVSIAVTGVDE